MVDKKNKLRAIDLYSGVGGWALGLRLAGIDVVASYERWDVANETNFKNNKHLAQTVDIRRLSLSDLPDNIDIVVGSPPCTQFSFSNRGGNGDIEDGLEDIIKFLTIVDHLKPKFWAMENVPRVKKILEHELRPKGLLAKFAHLKVIPHVVNMEEFGLPQRRQRCIAGNFNYDLLKSYATKTTKRNLGTVIRALATTHVKDPIYGVSLPKEDLGDHITEDSLNAEEVRINMSSKVLHPVYNAMAFPDPLDKSVRTITATCTRVSRESIVIEEPQKPGYYRRLTVRERACLQGFPLTFQFYGKSYGQKLRMVGNAVPPLFSYYVAHALQETVIDKVKAPTEFSNALTLPVPPAANAIPDRPGASYPLNRKFRFAIPSLRLKSGVRFELANSTISGDTTWRVAFYFGNSKSIQSLRLNQTLHDLIFSKLSENLAIVIRAELASLSKLIRTSNIAHMQRVWTHRGVGEITPFMLLDTLNSVGKHLIDYLDKHEALCQELIDNAILAEYGKASIELPGLMKLAKNARLIVAGLLVGSAANIELDKHAEKPSLPTKKISA